MPSNQLYTYRPLPAEAEILWRRFAERMSGEFDYADAAFPDFMLIGGPRSGTTWIYQGLIAHPYFYSDNTKEFQYFTWKWITDGIDSYRRRFEGKANRIRGDLTNLYSLLPLEAIAAIQRFNPDLKLIYVIRDPLSHAWSLARQDLRAGQRLFAEGEWRREDLTNAIFTQCFVHDYPLSAGDHAALLTRWLSFFPPRNFHICFNDHIQTRPDQVLVEIQEFLGLSPVLDPALIKFDGRAYSGISGDLDEELSTFLRTLWLGRTRKLAAFLKSAFGLDLPKDWDRVFSGAYISGDVPLFQWPEGGTCLMTGNEQGGMFYSHTAATDFSEFPFDLHYRAEQGTPPEVAEITGPHHPALADLVPGEILRKAFDPILEKRLKRLFGTFPPFTLPSPQT